MSEELCSEKGLHGERIRVREREVGQATREFVTGERKEIGELVLWGHRTKSSI